MCGYLGIITKNKIEKESIIESNKCQICRGPDETKFSSGVIRNSEFKFNLIFNRLAIIDLTQSASQPMYSEEFSTYIVFNGEIYNHIELREELEKIACFKSSHSDTEVVLIGLSIYGAEFINKLKGQFSIVFLDLINQKVLLTRDRLGQKPLFYSLSNNELIFSTNLKSIYKMRKSNEIDENQLNNYLNFGVIPSPYTLFKNIHKMKPATVKIFSLDNNLKIEKEYEYWKIKSFVGNKEFSMSEFRDKFLKSLELRMISDVPVSTFLSGGLDSTSIVKGLKEIKSEVNTFSIVHRSTKYDERTWINQVVNKYKTNHFEVEIENELDEHVFEAINSLDEVYADPSIVPSYSLSKKISENFKVAISGDGGDELLAGYSRFQSSLIKKNIIENYISKLYYLYPAYLGSGSKFLMKSKDSSITYFATLEDKKLMKILNLKSLNNLNTLFASNEQNIYKNQMLKEYNFFLSEMMLLKVDRTSMANSVEVRSPFVDHELVEYFLSSDVDKYLLNNPKSFLKKYLSEDFDEIFLNRKKMGFSFNTEEWVYNNLITIKKIINSGEVVKNIDKNIISKLSIVKTRINSHRIWKLLVLESYLKSLKS